MHNYIGISFGIQNPHSWSITLHGHTYIKPTKDGAEQNKKEAKTWSNGNGMFVHAFKSVCVGVQISDVLSFFGSWFGCSSFCPQCWETQSDASKKKTCCSGYKSATKTDTWTRTDPNQACQSVWRRAHDLFGVDFFNAGVVVVGAVVVDCVNPVAIVPWRPRYEIWSNENDMRYEEHVCWW